MLASLVSFIKKTITWFLKWELGRFLIVGGINTLMGGIIIPLIMKEGLNLGTLTFLSLSLDLPLTIGYLVWFSFAYLIQIKYVFNSRFELKRYLIYPLSQIPNYLINSLFLYIFGTTLNLPSLVSYVLAALLAVPVMFIIVRIIVKTKPKEVKGSSSKEKNT